MPGFPVLHYLLKFAQTQVHWDGDAIQISHSLYPFSSCPHFLPASGSFPITQLYLHISWPVHWSFSFSISPCNEYSVIISFSVQFSRSVISDSLQPHGLQHTRPPCPSPTPLACSNSCPLSWWCLPTSIIPFFSRLQSFPTSGSFPMSQFFPSGGQSIEVSASAAVLPMNIQYWWLDLLAVQGTLKSLLQPHNSKASIFFSHSAFLKAKLSHLYIATWKIIAFP